MGEGTESRAADGHPAGPPGPLESGRPNRSKTRFPQKGGSAERSPFPASRTLGRGAPAGPQATLCPRYRTAEAGARPWRLGCQHLVYTGAGLLRGVPGVGAGASVPEDVEGPWAPVTLSDLSALRPRRHSPLERPLLARTAFPWALLPAGRGAPAGRRRLRPGAAPRALRSARETTSGWRRAARRGRTPTRTPTRTGALPRQDPRGAACHPRGGAPSAAGGPGGRQGPLRALVAGPRSGRGSGSRRCREGPRTPDGRGSDIPPLRAHLAGPALPSTPLCGSLEPEQGARDFQRPGPVR